MKKIIKLPARYNLDNHLELLSEEDKTYILKSEAGDYFRVGTTDKEDEYDFIDPTGGPMIYLNDTIYDTNLIVDRIYSQNSNIVLKLKEKDA